MNTTTRTLALTLAAIAGTATIHTATAAATPNCTGRAALNTITIDIHDSTYTATFTPTPGCDNTPVTIASHDTAHLTWDPTEVQPLIASMTVTASAGRLEWTLPAGVAPRCRLQLDLVTGPALDVVDGAHRYNELAIGGSISRLIDARYSEAACRVVAEPTPMPTTIVDTPTTVIVTLPPVFDEPLEEAPTTTTPAVTATPSTVPPASSSTVPLAVVGGDPTPEMLPVTGVDTRFFVAWAVGAFSAAVAFFAGARKCRNREDIR